MKQRSVLSNSIWMIFEKLLKLILAIVVSGILARHFGTENYGIYNLSLSILLILTVVSNAGLSRISVREGVKFITRQNIKNIHEVFTTVFYLKLIFSIVIVLGSFIVLYLSKTDNWYLFLIVISSLIFSPFQVYELYCQSNNNIKKVSVTKSIISISISFIKLIFVYYNVEFELYFYLILFEFILLSLIYIFIIRKLDVSFFNIKFFNKIKAVDFLKESWVEIIAGFGGILFMKIDLVMISFLSSLEQVGIYSAGIKISEAWYFIPLAIVSSTYPYIIRLKEKDHKKYIDSISFVMSFICVLSLFFIFIITFSSSFVIEFIFGKLYIESSNILDIHTWCSLFIFMGSVSGTYLAIEKKLYINMYRNIIGLLVNISLNLLLIPVYGAEGAAYATLVSIIVAFFLFDLFCPSLRFMFKIKCKSFLIFSFLNKKNFNLFKYL